MLRVIPNAYPILVRLEVSIPGGRLFISKPLEHLVVRHMAPHLLGLVGVAPLKTPDRVWDFLILCVMLA